MGNKAEAIRTKKARNKGYYASNISENKYKYAGANWHAWMDGYRESHSGEKIDYSQNSDDKNQEKELA